MSHIVIKKRKTVQERCLSGFKHLNEHIETPFLCCGLLLIIALITFQSIYRYILAYFATGSEPPVWTTELSRFTFVWISYLAISVAIKKHSNIRVDIIFDLLPKKAQHVLWPVTQLLFLIFTAFMTYAGIHHISIQQQFPQLTPVLQLPYSIPYLSIPVSFGLMCIRLLQELYYSLKKHGVENMFYACCITYCLIAIVMYPFPITTSALLFIYFGLFLFLAVPVSIALGLAALVVSLNSTSLPALYLAPISFTAVDSFPIMAIPFFIAAGTFMGEGGLSRRLLTLADTLLGSCHGGLALATIASCMFFASISGSGPATVAAIGSLAIPAMIQRGYSPYFSGTIVAAAGAIGVMIPPSNPFIIYGIVSEESIGDLFLSGIFPGLLMGSSLMIVAYFFSKKYGWKGKERSSNMKDIVCALWEAKGALLIPIIVLGGIYGGIVTPTEAGAIASSYGLFIGVFIYKEINKKNIVSCLMTACSTSAVVIMLIAMARIFGNVMTISHIPEKIVTFLLSLTSNKIMILLAINTVLLIVGTFMETLAAILILTPIFLPIVLKVGIDPTHFGVMMVVNLAIGFVTPPVGINLFVASGIAKTKIHNLITTLKPFLIAMILVLFLITYIPSISLFILNR